MLLVATVQLPVWRLHWLLWLHGMLKHRRLPQNSCATGTQSHAMHAAAGVEPQANNDLTSEMSMVWYTMPCGAINDCAVYGCMYCGVFVKLSYTAWDVA
jgi:hypothetical protein